MTINKKEKLENDIEKKKKMFLKILIILIVSSKCILCLISTDMCTSLVCRGKHSYKCEKGLCGLNATTCDDYYRFTQNHAFHLTRMLINFQIKIQTCDIYKTQIKYCRKNKKCLKYSKSKINEKIFFKAVYCECDVKYSFKCGQYCTLDKQYCDLINLKIKYQNNNQQKTNKKICS